MSGGSQSAPTPYQPPNQKQAAQGFQTGTNQLATAGAQLYGQVAPQLSAIAGNIAANPYYSQALTGAQNAANVATTQVAPQQLSGANQDTSIANLAALAGPQYANAASQAGATGYNQLQSLLPQATAGAAAAPGVFNQAQSLIPQTTQGGNYAPDVLQALAGTGALTAGLDLSALGRIGTTGLQAGESILNTGFDPQSALYNRQFQQQQDQTNATAAQNGLAGSPFAAGLSNQANTNFNIDWQNAQLARQVSALGAYDSAASTYAGNTANLASGAIGNLATGLNSGVSDYNALNSGAVNNLVNLQTSGVNNFNALNSGAVNNATNLVGASTGALNSGINTATGALTSLGNLTNSSNAAASALGTQGLNTLAGAAQLPQDIFLQQQQAELAALGAQIQGTNASEGLTQQAVADQGSYLSIGQQAAQGAIQAAQVNNQASAASSAGFGNLFGSIAGMFSFSPIPI